MTPMVTDCQTTVSATLAPDESDRFENSRLAAASRHADQEDVEERGDPEQDDDRAQDEREIHSLPEFDQVVGRHRELDEFGVFLDEYRERSPGRTLRRFDQQHPVGVPRSLTRHRTGVNGPGRTASPAALLWRRSLRSRDRPPQSRVERRTFLRLGRRTSDFHLPGSERSRERWCPRACQPGALCLRRA